MNNELDPQNSEHELAHVSSEEVCDGHLDAQYEERTETDDEPHGPGDGSGTDELADANANEADDYRDEGREDFGWAGDEALCGE